eukprot:4406533-Pleurochrysis_carterae.AAC.1
MTTSPQTTYKTRGVVLITPPWRVRGHPPRSVYTSNRIYDSLFRSLWLFLQGGCKIKSLRTETRTNISLGACGPGKSPPPRSLKVVGAPDAVSSAVDAIRRICGDNVTDAP